MKKIIKNERARPAFLNTDCSSNGSPYSNYSFQKVGTAMLTFFILLLCTNVFGMGTVQLDTIPTIDSVTYEKINGDFYKREYTSEYAIFYTIPEDSTSLDADSLAFDIILDSLYRKFDVADRRINRLKDRIDLEQENKRELRNQILDARIRQRELLRIRRRYYRQL